MSQLIKNYSNKIQLNIILSFIVLRKIIGRETRVKIVTHSIKKGDLVIRIKIIKVNFPKKTILAIYSTILAHIKYQCKCICKLQHKLLKHKNNRIIGLGSLRHNTSKGD